MWFRFLDVGGNRSARRKPTKAGTRGHSHWKVVRGCAAVMTLFSGQSALPGLINNLPSMRRSYALHFQFLEKFCIFCFGQNFSSQDANFCSQDPSFFKENPLPRPYFGNPCGTHPGEGTPIETLYGDVPPKWVGFWQKIPKHGSYFWPQNP